MSNNEFEAFAKKAVADYYNARVDATSKAAITAENVYIVWMVKALQNNKALLSTTVPDNMYYELTYNGDKNEAYLDAYRKWENVVIKGVAI